MLYVSQSDLNTVLGYGPSTDVARKVISATGGPDAETARIPSRMGRGVEKGYDVSATIVWLRRIMSPSLWGGSQESKLHELARPSVRSSRVEGAACT